jgi:hypothetical protein
MSDLPAVGRENLARQKRFLLAMCVILAAFYALGARVCDDVTYSGFVVTVARPELTVYGLWAVWGWALLTYLQRLHKLFDVVRASIEADVDTEDRRMALRVGQRFALKKANAADFGLPVTDITVDRKSVRIDAPFEDIVDERGKVHEVQEVEHYSTMKGGRKFKHMNAVVRGVKKRDGNPFTKPMPFTMEWGPWYTRWHVLKAWTRALFGRPAITEHFGPLLAVVLTVTAAAHYWNSPGHPRECGPSDQKIEATN